CSRGGGPNLRKAKSPHPRAAHLPESLGRIESRTKNARGLLPLRAVSCAWIGRLFARRRDFAGRKETAPGPGEVWGWAAANPATPERPSRSGNAGRRGAAGEPTPAGAP